MLQVAEKKFLSALRKDGGDASCSPADHEGPQWSRYSPSAREGLHAGLCLKEAVQKAHAGSCFWQELQPVEIQEQGF